MIDTRTVIKYAAGIASALWMSLTIYQEFFDVDPDQFSFKSPEVESRMKACGGSFQQRYECKEAVILAKGRDSFIIWLEKVAIILGPPMILALLLNRFNRERPRDEEDYYTRRPPPVSKRRVR